MPNISTFNGDKEKYNQYMREYRKKNAEKMREYKRIYNAKWRKENGYPSEKKHKEKYPEKYRARQAHNAFIYRGKIKREPCIVCGEIKSQAHHEDYSKPHDIIWLCGIHHKKVHMSSLEIVLKNKD